MEEKKNYTLYILMGITIISLIVFFSLSFLNVFTYKNDSFSIYTAAFGFKDLNNSPMLIISIIFSLISLMLLIVLLILLPFKKKRYVYILLDALSLPLLSVSLVSNLFMLPIFKLSNENASNLIKLSFGVAIPQIICLFISILLNISILFYLSIKGYKRYEFARKKEDK